MKTIWDESVRQELITRIAGVDGGKAAQIGLFAYKHSDHHLRQFGC